MIDFDDTNRCTVCEEFFKAALTSLCWMGNVFLCFAGIFVEDVNVQLAQFSVLGRPIVIFTPPAHAYSKHREWKQPNIFAYLFHFPYRGARCDFNEFFCSLLNFLWKHHVVRQTQVGWKKWELRKWNPAGGSRVHVPFDRNEAFKCNFHSFQFFGLKLLHKVETTTPAD